MLSPDNYEDQQTSLRDVPSADITVDSTMFKRLEKYFKSIDGLELTCCVLIWVAGIVYEIAASSPRQRPIPFQQLESTGEFIENQIYSQLFEGETVTTHTVWIRPSIPLSTGIELAGLFA
eukprot:Nitzschia sp. Nitz4//scaffold58_size112336//43657//44162//NITZ4_004029-RA/size112336-processed-gene-0.86-mRNA-1//-1//CDS//3329554977//8245//frame0